MEEPEAPQDPTPADVPAREPAPAEEPVEPLDPHELAGGLEALLFVMDDPVDEETLAGALGCTVDQVRSGLADLAAGYDERRSGLTLRKVGEGWRLYTREEHAPVVERYLLGGQRNRLTQAALETLAGIAYRQPGTPGRGAAVRGGGGDAGVRTPGRRRLIRGGGGAPG